MRDQKTSNREAELNAPTRMAEAKKLPPLSSHAPAAKVPQIHPQAQKTPLVKLLECPVCTNKFPVDGVCEICNRLYAVSLKAAERRQQYHLYKKGLAPRPA